MKIANSIHRGLAVCFILLFSTTLVFAQEAKEDTTTIAAYLAVKGKLTPDSEFTLSAADKKTHDTIWKAVTALVPTNLLNLVSRLEFFEPVESNSDTNTDGWIEQSDDSQSFTLGLSLPSAKSAFIDRDAEVLPDFEHTIIHEFGHVLSFRASQMDQNSTGTLQIEEGTFKKDAYLNVFYEKFWKNTYPNLGTSTSSEEEGTALYNSAPASFVNDYAATGLFEDFAESFNQFVTGNKPKSNAIKDQKVLIFYTWPELVTYRDQFRKALSTR